jgi:hypothetical protein
MPIRPSSLAIAKHCALAPVLSERFPTTSAATERGNTVDAQVTAWVQDGTPPTDPDAKACVEWLCATFDPTEWEFRGQVALPPVCEGAAPGTADLVAHHCDGKHVVVDYKKREQDLAGRLPAPDDNDQLHAYALASGSEYQLCLLLFGAGKVDARWSQDYGPHNTGPIMERIKATCAPVVGEPKGTAGDHCVQCYPRLQCPHWARRATDGLKRQGPYSVEDGPDLIAEAKAHEDAAEFKREIAKAIVDTVAPFRVGSQEYRQVWMPGKMSIDGDALERDGLYERYAKVGNPFPQYRLSKPGKGE